MLRAITFRTLSHTACCHALRSFLSRTPSAFCLCVIAFCSLSHADQGKRHDADAVAAAALVARSRQFCARNGRQLSQRLTCDP